MRTKQETKLPAFPCRRPAISLRSDGVFLLFLFLARLRRAH